MMIDFRPEREEDEEDRKKKQCRTCSWEIKVKSESHDLKKTTREEERYYS